MRAPCITCWRATTEAANEIATEAIATVCAKRRPSFQPRNPARIAPASGANAAMQERVIRSMVFAFSRALSFLFLDGASQPRRLALQASQVGYIDGTKVAEERHEDRQPDRGFRGRHREDEEHEHLSGDVAQLVRERDEVHVDGEQHQLDRHEDHDQVLAVEEDAGHADREEQRAEDEVVLVGNHRVSDMPFTTFSRSPGRTASCVRGSWYLVSLRVRSVMAMAATMATSRITEASSKG